MSSPGYRKRVVFLLFCMLLVRFWLGQTFELHGEEAYLWNLSYGNHLDWGYWDRGILVPWLMKVGTWFFGDNVLGVRWVAAVIYTITGFLIFWAARKWFSSRAAFWSVVLYMVTPLYAWQLLLFTDATASLGLMMLALVCYREAVDTDRWLWWIAAGVISGLAIHVSWFNGIWPLGLLAFMLVDPLRRHQLREWRTLFVPLCSLLAVVPIVAWYMRPEAAGLQMERIRTNAPLVQDSYDFSILSAFEFIGGQIGLLSPGVFIGMLIAFYLAGSVTFTHRHYSLLMWLSLPGLAVQVIASFFGAEDAAVLAALYLPALFLAGNFWVTYAGRDVVWRGAGVAILVLAGVQSLLGIIPWTQHTLAVPSGLYPRDGYEGLAEEVLTRKQEYGAVVVFAEDPMTASALTFYMPQGQAANVPIGANVRSQFDFWDPGYEDLVNNRALVVTRGRAPSPAVLRQFESVEEVPNIRVPRAEGEPWRIFVTQKFNSDMMPVEHVSPLEGAGGGVDEDLPEPGPEPVDMPATEATESVDEIVDLVGEAEPPQAPADSADGADAADDLPAPAAPAAPPAEAPTP